MLSADAVEDRQDVVLLYELSRQRDRLRDLELVVLVLVDDLASEDAAFRVDVLEVRVGASADGGIRGSRAGERNRPAERDAQARPAGNRGDLVLQLDRHRSRAIRGIGAAVGDDDLRPGGGERAEDGDEVCVTAT